MAKLIPGETDLATVNPELIKEWHPTKNGDLEPCEVTPNSHKSVWWKCSTCGYEWQNTVAHRNNGTGCPACINRVLWEGHNDLATLYPDLAIEWDYKKNNLAPNKIIAGGHIKVWWKCSSCGHEWQAEIKARVDGNNCPRCTFSLHTSLPEQCVFYYLKQHFPTAINLYKPDWLGGREIDIYIPDLNLGIEYDGGGWHSDPEKDREKSEIIKMHSISLIRIREPKCPVIDDGCHCIVTDLPKSDMLYLQNAITGVFEYINEKYRLQLQFSGDVRREYLCILDSYIQKQKENSLAIQNPSFLAEWDYSRNGGLSPDKLTFASNRRVWWKCSTCGYEWRTSIVNRQNGHGCARCAGQVAWEGHNDLATLFPAIAAEWNFEKNELKPSHVVAGSHKKAWWKCSKGHEWEATIQNRTRADSGCPYCSGRYANPGETDLATVNPELVKEWHTTKNSALLPSQVTRGSNKKVWWQCTTCGHEWEATVHSRSAGKGCPVCGHKRTWEARRKNLELLKNEFYT